MFPVAKFIVLFWYVACHIAPEVRRSMQKPGILLKKWACSSVQGRRGPDENGRPCSTIPAVLPLLNNHRSLLPESSPSKLL